MIKILKINKTLIALGVVFSIICMLILLMKSPLLKENNTLSLAITIDLLLFVPFVYFMFIRKTNTPKTTVVPIMIISLLVGLYFMPKENQTYLMLFKTWLLPLIEISVITYIIIKVRNTIKTYKETKDSNLDFFTTLKSACSKILPKKAVNPFATEIAIIYYGFINWKKNKYTKNEFTHHKNSGSLAIFGALILIIAIETVGLHFLLAKWSNIAAWVLTTLSVYTAIQILGFAKSIAKRPISINQNSLSLRYGIINEVDIKFSNIEEIELSKKSLNKDDKLTRTLSPLGESESHNVIIHLKETNELKGIYGIKKKFKTIGFHIDESQKFYDTIKVTVEQSKQFNAS
jgi:hypothetical protein